MTITLPLPPKSLHPNARPCWQAKARATKKARSEAALIARMAPDRPAEPWEKATVQATFYLKRKQDSDNLVAWTKATLDGLQGWIVVNDSGLTILPPIQIVGKDLDHRLELKVEETT